nr:hypothetical protein [Actinomadura darangshiensis]
MAEDHPVRRDFEGVAEEVEDVQCGRALLQVDTDRGTRRVGRLRRRCHDAPGVGVQVVERARDLDHACAAAGQFIGEQGGGVDGLGGLVQAGGGDDVDARRA